MKRKFKISILILLVFSGISIRAYSQTIKDQLGSSIDMVVSKKGNGNFTTIQEAINAIPDNNTSRKVIYIENGAYFEKVVVPVSKTNITMIGEDMDSTILLYDDSPDKADTLWEY